MAENASVVRRLQRQVAARNQELTTEIVIDLAMGVFVTALTSGVVFALSWFLAFWLGGVRVPAVMIAAGVTAIVLLVGVVSAWRQVNPLAGLKPMSAADHLAVQVSRGLGGVTYVNRHSVAGIATLLLAGPENLVSAFRSWLHRLPSEAAVLDEAAGILLSCKPEADLRKIEVSPQAVQIVRRLNLIVARDQTTTISLTEKGRDIVRPKNSAANA
ncbi:MAG: hypothetical protein ACKVT0_19785 [Planctomycetaceae bacterium]